MALFPFGKKDPLQQIQQRAWNSVDERDQLIEQALGENGTRDLEVLAQLLFLNESSVRRAALKRIHQIGNPTISEVFLKVARRQPANVIPGLVRSLLKAVPNCHERALRHMDHSDASIRRIVEIFALSGPMTKVVLDRAKAWLEPNSDSVRAMRLMETLTRNEVDPKVTHSMALLAVDHRSEKVRGRGWLILVERNDPADLERFIQGMLEETYFNQKTLADAVGKLVNHPKADSSAALLPLLSHTDNSIRTTGVNILKQLDNMDHVVRHFTRHARDMATLERERAFETLRDLGDRVLPALIELMDDQDREVRNLAITMASTIGEHPGMVRPLVRALKEPDWWIRATAVETLGQIGSTEVIQPLIQQLEDEDTVWTAIGSLVSTARRLKKEGNTQAQQEALAPLLSRLKGGQQGKGEVKDEEAAEIRVEVLNALIQAPEARFMELFKQVARGDVHPRVRDEALKAATVLARETGQDLAEEELREQASSTEGLTRLQKMLAEARRQGASDLHISADQPVMIRRNAELNWLEDDTPLSVEDAARLLREILEDEQAARVATDGQVSFCCTVPGHGRYRASVFADYRGLNAVFRVIPRELPTIQSIGLPGQFSQVQYWHQGLLLVCGASGTGKTTTLAALVNLINETRESHILTIEDPIEYVHTSRRSLINQRELLGHTSSYHRALRGALRQDPDVIVIGELSDTETVSLALEASETGHLVIGTLNSTTAVSGIERVINSFSQDEQNQIRLALSESLKAIIAQSLAPTTEGEMTAIFEILMGTDTIRNLIRENKLLMIDSVMQTGRSQGMQTADDALMELVRAGTISPEVAVRRARNQNTLDELSSTT